MEVSVETPAASSPEALDDLVGTTTTRGWIALVAAAVAVLVGIIWSFTATVPSQTSATAVVYEPDATYRVVAGTAGAVELTVQPGASVTAGQEIGHVTPFVGEGARAPSTRPIAAPVAGVVSGIAVAPGAAVDAATVVAVVNRPAVDASSVPLVTFLTSSDAVLYRPGQEVMATLSDLSTSDTMVLPATVTSVSNVPADLASMQLTLQDDSLAAQLLRDAGGVVYRVELRLTGVDGLAPIDRPAGGQLVGITNTYAEQHPVQLLFGSS